MMRSFFIFVTAIVIGAMPLAAYAELVGLWEFENAGDLSRATIGSDLVLTGSASAVAGSGGSDSGAAQLGNGDYFTAANPIGANGGGVNTNAYTLVMDMNAPGTGWNSLVDMDGDVFSGDGEVFTRERGGLGIDRDYFGVAADGSWHRIALVFDMASDVSMTTYIDGVLNHAHTDDELGAGNSGIDGRWSLLSTFNAFSDNGGGEEEILSVSNLALFNSALSASDISSLGSIPVSCGTRRARSLNTKDISSLGSVRVAVVPEPSTFALAAIAGLALIGLRRREGRINIHGQRRWFWRKSRGHEMPSVPR